MGYIISCVWLDEDGEEDILAQVGKVQEQGVRLTPGVPFYRKQGESITPDRRQELHRKEIAPFSFQQLHCSHPGKYIQATAGKSPAAGGGKALTAHRR